WQRHALVNACALVIDADVCGEPAERAALARLADRVTTPLVVLTRNATRVGRQATLAIEVAKPSRDEQRALWRRVLGDEAAASLDGTLDAMLAQFDLDGHAIETAAAQASVAPGANLGQRLWHSCRRGARTELDDVAQRIESTAAPDDLVLPAPQRATLGDISVHVRNRVRVYDDWRMGGPSARGLGISALFAGPSGTGKTLAAEVIAHQLELDLYRIDLSQVVSKYIGETERNLRRVFDAADEGGAVLLFDEADALFGKRSEVRDSHDRYANVEISYLLQRMESYRGLAILTTNMRTAIDPAFMRRLRFVVTFPFPDLERREAIWRRAFPAAAPIGGLDYGKLARLTVSGGNIRNIALYAAFLAADRGEPIGMAHLLRAARVECAKLERTPAETELGGWV
ncbi:MAG TPA: ATP-binding protein, partial [Candidatus Binataceae bacterium]|nr:ATP-binding protein [Candidatus Binataceae bacterium]